MLFRVILMYVLVNKLANCLNDHLKNKLNKLVKEDKIDIDYNDNVAVSRLINSIEKDYADMGNKFWTSWEELDARPIPKWYDEAKIGIFLHWGVFSVPGFGSEWFWYHWNNGSKDIINYMKENYPPNFSYQEFASMYKAELFDADAFAQFCARAGAKYVVVTTKHHDGFTLFPSLYAYSWNSVDIGPHRDLVGEIAKAVKKAGLKFGAYYSLMEWFHPLYMEDKDNFFRTQTFVNTKVWPEIVQLINDYEPSVLWLDGEWYAEDKYWRATEMAAWLYNESPVKDEIVVNDRWGMHTRGRHGDFYTYLDRFNPGTLHVHKWENAFTLDKGSWGYVHNMDLSGVLTTKELIYQVLTTVSCGGNALVNIGLSKEGLLPTIFQERLEALGDWLGVNGEAIYGTVPWLNQNDTLSGDVWYTCTRNGTVYASFVDWPDKNQLILKDVEELLINNYEITVLGNEDLNLNWTSKSGILALTLPAPHLLTSKHGWTIRFKPHTVAENIMTEITVPI